MSAPTTAVVTVAHGRHDHLRMQSAGLARSAVRPDIRCVVAMDDPDIAGLLGAGVEVIECPTTGDSLPLAQARNHGAQHATAQGAELVIFLDVDCIPGPSLVGHYLDAHRRIDGEALLAGPVTYLPAAPDGYRLDDLHDMTRPHPARPNPPSRTLVREPNHDLFWSLSFAVSAQTWRRLGGFCEDYAGYGGEDTDFACVAESLGVPLIWVGGAHAYHQHHPVSDPPVEHLEEIVVNARTFRRRWNRWPMTGWLDAFEKEGLLFRDGDEIRVTARESAPMCTPNLISREWRARS